MGKVIACQTLCMNPEKMRLESEILNRIGGVSVLELAQKRRNFTFVFGDGVFVLKR